MNGWAIWLVIAGMAVGTIVNRAGLIMLAGRFDLPPSVQASLRFAPAAALAAMKPHLLCLNLNLHQFYDRIKFVSCHASNDGLACFPWKGPAIGQARC